MLLKPLKAIARIIFSFKYHYIIKPILFRLNPEIVHEKAIRLGHKLGKRSLGRKLLKVFSYRNAKLSQNLLGCHFVNPVGLSAGFDKNAEIIPTLAPLGFGFAQIGSITNHPYGGNKSPRAQRIPEKKALLINYGLKNIGADRILERIRRNHSPIPLGISIAKTNSPKTVQLQDGVEDYKNCLRKVIRSEQGSFYTINISCPNTFGGEPFSDAGKFTALLDNLKQLNPKKPILIKMPINLAWDDFKKLLDIAIKHGVAGVVIGNLNKDYSSIGLDKSQWLGGISGKPTENLSNYLIGKTYQEYGRELVIVGVGGIFSAKDAYEKIKQGASLVQLITGMVYRGPQLIGQINAGLVHLLKKDGYSHISQAIGANYRRDTLS